MIDRKKWACGFFLIISLALVSLSSLCKKPNDDNLEPTNVSNNSGNSENPSIAVDSKNTVHLVWNDDTPGNEEIFYAYKPANGNWSTPINISNNTHESRFPCIAVDNKDVIHLVWQDNSPDGYWRIFYSQKTEGGNWSVPETITGNYMYVRPKIAIDDSCNVHLIWEYGGYYSGIRYAMRTLMGTWTPQLTVIEPIGIMDPSIAVDNQSNVHLTWYKFDYDSATSDIFYSMKTENGNWSQPENISNTGQALGTNSIVADNQRNIHCVWGDMSLPYLTPRTFYREKRPDGTWTNPVTPSTLRKVWFTSELAVGPQNELYLAGGDSVRFLYIVKPQDQVFSDTNLVGVVNKIFALWKLVCDNNGTLHLTWERDEEIFWISYNPNPRSKK